VNVKTDSTRFQKPNPSGVGRCQCGHAQPQHDFLETEVIFKKIGLSDLYGHGRCLGEACTCRKYQYVGWL
jgi:hypothetical protein